MTGGLSALIAISLMGARDGVEFVDGKRRAPEGQSAALREVAMRAFLDNLPRP